jgi:hypothetical protein
MGSWLGRYPIAEDSHIDDLERAAAVHEMHHGLPRDQAEATAHQKYKVLNHQKGAAHHLNGMRCAKANGNIQDSEKHYLIYCLHMKALGHNPNRPVPPDVMAHVTAEPLAKFTPHSADCFVNQKG